MINRESNSIIMPPKIQQKTEITDYLFFKKLFPFEGNLKLLKSNLKT